MTCCNSGCGAPPPPDGGHRTALIAVIAINATMFLVEMAGGMLAGSTALQADALDFLGDTATYGLTLFALNRSQGWRSGAALVKGASLAVFGLWVLGYTAWRVVVLGVPQAEVMGIIGGLALLANLASVVLLLRFRRGDANIRSVWLCSRNDAIGNLAVIAAAAGVAATASPWPDLAVAAIMASLFLWSATAIIRQALGELRAPDAAAGAGAD